MATPEQLLNDAINAMAELHDSMVPDDNEENAIVPPAAVRKFVDAHARLMYERERMTNKNQEQRESLVYAVDCAAVTLVTPNLN